MVDFVQNLFAQDFNPRTHEECDQQEQHAGAADTDFNPRTHEECDREAEFDNNEFDRFQSTHSRGVRRQHFVAPYVSGTISIHALTRSATPPKG